MSTALPTAEKIESSKTAIESHYENLHSQCGSILDLSLSSANGAKVARSHQLVHDFELWVTILQNRREVTLFKMVAHEYQYALLALTQGHYRHAFKGLRLVLELTLQATRLSTQEIELREWLQNKKDTIWGSLVDEENGVFSLRFARSFFCELESHVPYYRILAEQVYRECSECVHGNIPKHVPLPQTLTFSQNSFDLWHAKADVVGLLLHFVLAMRYLREFEPAVISKLETTLLTRLGHIQEIRVALGGPSTN